MKKLITFIGIMFVLSLPVVTSQEKDNPKGENEILQKKVFKGKVSRFNGLFFKAFYFEVGENNIEKAISLYKEFLEKTKGKSKFVWKAAERLSGLLERQGKSEEAKQIREKYLKPRPKKAKRKGGVNRDQWIKRMEKQIKTLEARKEKLEEEGGNDELIERLEKRINFMKRMLERVKAGEMPPPMGRMGRVRGMRGRRFRFSKMPEQQREQALDRLLERARRMAEKIRENGDEERAEKLLKACSDVEKAAQEGEWEKVDKIIGNIFQKLFRRKQRIRKF